MPAGGKPAEKDLDMDSNYEMMARFVNITEAAKALATQMGYTVMIDMQPLPGTRNIFEEKNAVATKPMPMPMKRTSVSKVKAALKAAKPREVLDLTPAKTKQEPTKQFLKWPHLCKYQEGLDPTWDALYAIANAGPFGADSGYIRAKLQISDYTARGLLSTMSRKGYVKKTGKGWVLTGKSYKPRYGIVQQANQEAIYEAIVAAGSEGIMSFRLASRFKFSGQMVGANLRFLRNQKRITLDREWVTVGNTTVQRLRARAVTKKSG